MHVDIRPTQFECRIFEEGDSYEQRSDFVGAFNVQLWGNTAWVSMLLGRWDRQVERTLERELVALGVVCITYEVHGQRRLRMLDRHKAA